MSATLTRLAFQQVATDSRERGGEFEENWSNKTCFGSPIKVDVLSQGPDSRASCFCLILFCFQVFFCWKLRARKARAPKLGKYLLEMENSLFFVVSSPLGKLFSLCSVLVLLDLRPVCCPWSCLFKIKIKPAKCNDRYWCWIKVVILARRTSWIKKSKANELFISQIFIKVCQHGAV